MIPHTGLGKPVHLMLRYFTRPCNSFCNVRGGGGRERGGGGRSGGRKGGGGIAVVVHVDMCPSEVFHTCVPSVANVLWPLDSENPSYCFGVNAPMEDSIPVCVIFENVNF